VFLLFLPHLLGAQKSEGFCSQGERLLYGRDPVRSREEPGKQKKRSRRAQELARSCAQGNVSQKKGQYRGQCYRN
jgi:hypothetical protein